MDDHVIVWDIETIPDLEAFAKVKVLSKWGNDLRQSYRTLAQAAGVAELDIHLLMNHSLPGVNAGYITRDRLLRDHLRTQQQRISDIAVGDVGKKRGSLVSGWLRNTKIDDSVDRTEGLAVAA